MVFQPRSPKPNRLNSSLMLSVGAAGDDHKGSDCIVGTRKESVGSTEVRIHGSKRMYRQDIRGFQPLCRC